MNAFTVKVSLKRVFNLYRVVSSSKEWTAKQAPALSRRRRDKDDESSQHLDASLTVSNLRRLLSRMIATGSIAIRELPTSTTTAFLSYTDFLALYVAFLNLMHASVQSA